MPVTDFVEHLVTYWLIALVTAAAISGLYILHIYRRRHESALFLDRLVKRNLRVVVCALVIGGYLLISLFGLSLGRPWGYVVIAAAVTGLIWGPISDALLWFRERGGSFLRIVLGLVERVRG